MMPTPTVDCYAVRRVNPFLGVLQVVRTEDGQATSTNGLTWEIQLQFVMPNEWGSLAQHSAQKTMNRHGIWSLEDGLVFLSVRRGGKELDQQCERLIDSVRNNLQHLPFQLQDSKELWLLDEECQRPLALLASIRPDDALPRPEPRYWSGCLGHQGATSQGRFPETDALEAQVKQRAGFNLTKRWYYRDILQHEFRDDAGNSLPSTLFPQLLLSQDWPIAGERERAGRYLHWIAAALLTLPNLSDDMRDYLEAQISERALCIEHQWRLYPKVLDQQKIKACRVQSKLIELGK
jgi:hypothetical protein